MLKTLGLQQCFKCYCSCLNSCIKTQQSLKSGKKPEAINGDVFNFPLVLPLLLIKAYLLC